MLCPRNPPSAARHNDVPDAGVPPSPVNSCSLVVTRSATACSRFSRQCLFLAAPSLRCSTPKPRTLRSMCTAVASKPLSSFSEPWPPPTFSNNTYRPIDDGSESVQDRFRMVVHGGAARDAQEGNTRFVARWSSYINLFAPSIRSSSTSPRVPYMVYNMLHWYKPNRWSSVNLWLSNVQCTSVGR